MTGRALAKRPDADIRVLLKIPARPTTHSWIPFQEIIEIDAIRRRNAVTCIPTLDAVELGTVANHTWLDWQWRFNRVWLFSLMPDDRDADIDIRLQSVALLPDRR